MAATPKPIREKAKKSAKKEMKFMEELGEKSEHPIQQKINKKNVTKYNLNVRKNAHKHSKEAMQKAHIHMAEHMR